VWPSTFAYLNDSPSAIWGKKKEVRKEEKTKAQRSEKKSEAFIRVRPKEKKGRGKS